MHKAGEEAKNCTPGTQPRSASRVSTSASVECAKQDAEERLASYHASAAADPDGWADITLVETLDWELKPWRFGSHPKMVEPTPRWVAQVSDNPSDVFSIRDLDVLT